MVAACRAAGVKLMIAYRCQYEPFNREAIRLIRSGELGRPRAARGHQHPGPGPGRAMAAKAPLAGGGALPDIGLYCLNGVRAMLGEEPVEVFARIVKPAGDDRYREVEETMAFMLRFPSGAIANCATSYGAHESKDLRIRLEKGWIDLENAFAYRGQRLRVARRERRATRRSRSCELGPRTSSRWRSTISPTASCRTPRRARRARKGCRTRSLMEALYRSAREGGPVAIPPVAGTDAFRGAGPD